MTSAVLFNCSAPTTDEAAFFSRFLALLCFDLTWYANSDGFSNASPLILTFMAFLLHDYILFCLSDIFVHHH